MVGKQKKKTNDQWLRSCDQRPHLHTVWLPSLTWREKKKSIKNVLFNILRLVFSYKQTNKNKLSIMTFITYIKFYCVHVVLMKIVYTSSLLEPDDPGLLWSSEKDQNSPSKQVRTSPGLSGNLEYKWWGWKQGWKYFSVVVCVPSVSDSLVLSLSFSLFSSSASPGTRAETSGWSLWWWSWQSSGCPTLCWTAACQRWASSSWTWTGAWRGLQRETTRRWLMTLELVLNHRPAVVSNRDVWYLYKPLHDCTQPPGYYNRLIKCICNAAI